jgi:anti-anti-sigma factor
VGAVSGILQGYMQLASAKNVQHAYQIVGVSLPNILCNPCHSTNQTASLKQFVDLLESGPGSGESFPHERCVLEKIAAWPSFEVTTITVLHQTKDFMSLHLSIRESDDVTIMDLRGRSTISGGESELLSGYLQELIAKGVRKLLLNIGNLTQVDSSGVSIIIETYVSLKRQGGDLKLLCPGGRVLQVLNVFHLLDIIPSFDDEAQALGSFGPRSYSASS